ncbi:hypothetical protein [Salinirarus marinus]|uniref:hypothetical protein n=1 Tax=Salinirarus marinus TaxID=3068310 RepID=UPI003C6C3765
MAKVSIGLRGWRFDEREVFTGDGEFRPLDEVPDDARQRLLRLIDLVEEPCDACYLVYGEGEKRRCNQATIVYGEPLEEVVLCDDHEADFLYWYREAGGKQYRGEAEFRDAFHEWFADGGRAPEGYAGLDHVETDPDALPDPPDPKEVQERIEAEAEFEGRRIDLHEYGDGDEGAREDGEDLDLDAVDLDTDYPTR